MLRTLGGLLPARTLDVACGTGFVSARLPGDVTALDQSARMLDVAAKQAPNAALVRGSGLELPFADRSFERVFTSHFYGHLDAAERQRFLAEARRVAPELVVLDAALHRGEPREEWQERELNDGTRWSVYKRFFSDELLRAELGGGETLFAGTWFVCVRSPGGATG